MARISQGVVNIANEWHVTLRIETNTATEGIAATRLRAAAFNAMQEELAHIVESAGLALDINDMTQVLKAIQKLTLSRANPFADIKSDGAAAISTALTNLGIKDASTTQVGLVRLTSSRVSGAEDIAATANAVAQNYTDIKALQNKTQDATTTQNEPPRESWRLNSLRKR